jgi:hypothetical protein
VVFEVNPLSVYVNEVQFVEILIQSVTFHCLSILNVVTFGFGFKVQKKLSEKNISTSKTNEETTSKQTNNNK